MEEKHERVPSVRTELIAGVTTFFTMAYIVAVTFVLMKRRPLRMKGSRQ